MLTMALCELALLNTNCNADKPGNVNPEFGPNEGCGCTMSYNGGAGGGTAAPCCDGKPYEDGFNDKKRDATCCCESSRCYERPLVNKKPDGECSADFKYVPEFNYPPAPCPPIASSKYEQPASGGCCGGTYQGGLTNKKPECSAEFKYVVPSADPKPKCFKGEDCCTVKQCNEPDSYEMIANKDAQRYKGKGPDRSTFYADDGCGCQQSNNASSNNNILEEDTDWSEIRRYAYAAVECSNSPKLARKTPSFYCEEENYINERRPRYMADVKEYQQSRRISPLRSSPSMRTEAVTPVQQTAGNEKPKQAEDGRSPATSSCIIS